MGPGFRLADELDPFMNQCLSRFVLWMCFPGDDELYGTLRVGQQAKQPWWVVQKQVWSFIGREASRKAERQYVGIKEMLRSLHRLG